MAITHSHAAFPNNLGLNIHHNRLSIRVFRICIVSVSGICSVGVLTSGIIVPNLTPNISAAAIAVRATVGYIGLGISNSLPLNGGYTLQLSDNPGSSIPAQQHCKSITCRDINNIRKGFFVVSNLHRIASILIGTIAQLTIAVIAPGKDHTIRAQSHGMVFAYGDLGCNSFSPQNCHRNHLADTGALTDGQNSRSTVSTAEDKHIFAAIGFLQNAAVQHIQFQIAVLQRTGRDVLMQVKALVNIKGAGVSHQNGQLLIITHLDSLI